MKNAVIFFLKKLEEANNDGRPLECLKVGPRWIRFDFERTWGDDRHKVPPRLASAEKSGFVPPRPAADMPRWGRLRRRVHMRGGRTESSMVPPATVA